MSDAVKDAAAVRRGYVFFNSGDLAGLAGVFAEDVIWHAAGNNQLSGEKRGRDACFAYFGRLAELSGGTFRAELHDVVSGEAHTVGVHTSVAEREGRRLNERTLLLLHMHDGTILEGWEYYENPSRVDAFFG